LHWYQQLHDYAEAARDTFWLARLPNTVGGVHLELFNSAEALRLNLAGEEHAHQYSAWPEPRGHSVVKAGLAYLQQGQHGPAEACFRRAETLLEVDPWMRWRWQMALLRAWGDLALAQGRLDDAWTYAGQSFALATRSHSRKHMARAQFLQGDILRVGGRLAEAVHTLEAAICLATQIGTPRERWLGQATLGTVLRQLGREQEAETQLTRATQTIEAIAAHLRTPPLRHSFLQAAPVVAVYDALGHRPPLATP
jgi:tetratricopeptide (TPR) repeat protein